MKLFVFFKHCTNRNSVLLDISELDQLIIVVLGEVAVTLLVGEEAAVFQPALYDVYLAVLAEKPLAAAQQQIKVVA